MGLSPERHTASERTSRTNFRHLLPYRQQRICRSAISTTLVCLYTRLHLAPVTFALNGGQLWRPPLVALIVLISVSSAWVQPYAFAGPFAREARKARYYAWWELVVLSYIYLNPSYELSALRTCPAQKQQKIYRHTTTRHRGDRNCTYRCGG